MKPTSSRAARRMAAKSGKAMTIADLAARAEKARPKGLPPALATRAKRILMSYLQMAETHGMPVKDVIAEMVSGQAAWRLGHAVREEIMKAPPEAVKNAACKEGCAFCCILTEGDGGLITQFEAQQLQAALAPLAGKPDGRAWHPQACPALDPNTRGCRAYDARPMVCRSFLSTDAAACERNAAGGEEAGAGLLGSHLDYLAVHALCRAALRGLSTVPTYGLSQVAAATVAGKDQANAMAAAKHGSGQLDTTCRDAVQAAG